MSDITLKLVQDNSTLFDFNDQINSSLLRDWKPPSSRMRRGTLGNDEYYLPADTEIPIRLYNTTKTGVKAVLTALADAMQQVDRWNGDDALPVSLVYQASDTDLSEATQTLVLDAAYDRSTLLDLPVTFNEYLDAYEVNPILVPLRLRGGMYGPEDSASSTLSPNPAVNTASLGEAAAQPSPTSVLVQGFSDDNRVSIPPGILLVTNKPGNLLVTGTDSMVNGPEGYATATGTAGSNPTDGTVLRLTPHTPDYYHQSLEFDLTGTSFDLTAKRLGFFASIQINAANGETVSMRVLASAFSGGRTFATVPVHLPEANYSTPIWVPLGITTIRDGYTDFLFEISFDDITNSPTVDIDHVAILALRPSSYAVYHGQSPALASPFIGTPSSAVSIGVEDRILEDRRPWTGAIEENGNQVSMGFQGDKRFFMTGDKVVAAWLGTGSSDWVVTHKTTDNPIELRIAVTRRVAYLTPQ